MKKKEIEDEKVQMTIKIKKRTHDELEEMAKKMELSKTQLVVNLIETGLDDVKIFNKLGLTDLMIIGGRITKKIKEKFYSGEATIENGELKIKMQK